MGSNIPAWENLLLSEIDASLGNEKVYVVDENIAGEKYAHLICSQMFECLTKGIPGQFKTILIFLGAHYFKNNYLMWWASEMIMKRTFKKVILVFMVPGHTKFGADSFFARIAHKFYKTDIFNAVELLDLIATCDVKTYRVKAQDLRR